MYYPWEFFLYNGTWWMMFAVIIYMFVVKPNQNQPKWRRYGSLVILFLLILTIITSFLFPVGILIDAQTEFSPFASLMAMMLIFEVIFGSRMGVWGVFVGLIYTFFIDILLPDCYGYGECGLQWLFPPFKTMWVIIPSLFFAIIGFAIEYWYKSSEKKTIHLS